MSVREKQRVKVGTSERENKWVRERNKRERADNWEREQIITVTSERDHESENQRGITSE